MLVSMSGCFAPSTLQLVSITCTTALQPPSIGLGSCTSPPGWPCWSAWKDDLRQAPSFSSPSLAPPALRPPSIDPQSRILTLPLPCCLAFLHLLGQVPSVLFP